jgi:hypothetical protein
MKPDNDDSLRLLLGLSPDQSLFILEVDDSCGFNDTELEMVEHKNALGLFPRLNSFNSYLNIIRARQF